MGKYEKLDKKYSRKRSLIDQYTEMLMLLYRWIVNLINGKSTVHFFETKKYKKIAVYGKNWMTRRLQRELKGTDIAVDLVFDKNSIENIKDCDADVIVVTSLYHFYEIQMELEKLTDLTIVSIAKIVLLAYYVR